MQTLRRRSHGISKHILDNIITKFTADFPKKPSLKRDNQ